MTFKTILTILAMSSLKATAAVTPTSGSLIINEIMSANVDQYFSPTVNFLFANGASPNLPTNNISVIVITIITLMAEPM